MPSEPPAVLRLPPHRSVLPLGRTGRLLGLDPATALAVDDLSPPLAQMLDRLDTPVERGLLVDRAVERGANAEDAEALLGELVAAGALIDAGEVERAARHRAASSVLVAGAGPLVVGIVAGLVHGGVGAVHVATGGTVGAGELGTGSHDSDIGRARLGAVRAAVRRLSPGASTGPPPRGHVPDLVVLADTTPEPTRVADLLADRTAHLASRLRDGVGIVGPLVLPGRSACLGCLELHRSARDPGWPAVSAQLVGRRGSADPACTAATAALATAQALAALDGSANGAAPPPTLDATLELDMSAGTLIRRVWAPRRECRCGAAEAHGHGAGGMRHG